MTFEEIILLLTLMGSCIYATISLTLKFVEFQYNNSDYLQKARKYGHFTGYKN